MTGAVTLLLCGSACSDGTGEPNGATLFGASVALSGRILAVGAPGPGDNGVHVYYRAEIDASQPWRHRQWLAAPPASAADGFGRALAITRDADAVTVAVGSPGLVVIAVAETPDEPDFVERARLPSEDDSGDSFGHSVALAGDTLAVGAPDAAGGRGAVYLYRHTAGQWLRTAALTGLYSDIGDRFGASVALVGSVIAVGAPDEASAAAGVDGDASDDSAPRSGAAYAFRHDGSDWRIDGYLKASNSDAGDHFGASIAAGPGLIVVGAPREASASMAIDGDQADNSEPGAGAVYAYRHTPGGWQHISYLKPGVPGAFEEFGHSVAVTGSQVAVLHGDYLHLFATDAGVPTSADENADPWAGSWVPAGLFFASFDGTRRYCRTGPGCLAGDSDGLAISGRDLVASDPSAPPAGPDVMPDVTPEDDGIRAVYVYRNESTDWKLDSALIQP